MKYMQHKCIVCGKERRIEERKGKPRSLCCHSCSHIGFRHSEESKARMRKNSSGNKNGMWKGGQYSYCVNGYKAILIRPNDFFYSMAMGNSYVLEHRLIMAKHIGRCLHRWEIVHHKNHIRNDNGIENLQLVSDDRHKQITLLENRIGRLEKRVIVLEAENVLLRKSQKVY